MASMQTCSVCELLGNQSHGSKPQQGKPCPVCKKTSTPLPDQWREQVLALPQWLREVIAHLIGSSLPNITPYTLQFVSSGSSHAGTERETYVRPEPSPDLKHGAPGPFVEPPAITAYAAACLGGVDPNQFDLTHLQFACGFQTLELAFSAADLRLAESVEGSFTDDADRFPSNMPPTSLIKGNRLLEAGFRYTGHLAFVRGDHSGRVPRGVCAKMSWC